MKLLVGCVVVGFLSLALSLVPLTLAQTPAQTASALPRLVRFGGTMKGTNGSPLTGVVGITFALYSEQTGGAALWLETQNVTADNNGHYTVMLGATEPGGLPAELFTSEQARWVGVQVSGQAEQSRVLLVSAPYALKAGDAETIGGLPPSAFVLAAPVTKSATATDSGATASSASVAPPATSNVTTAGGTVNFIPKFDTGTDIKISQIFDNGTNVGIGNGSTAPAAKLDVFGTGMFRGVLTLPSINTANSTTKGFNSQPFDLLASVFKGTAAVSQHFRLQAEPVNPGLSTASGKLNLLFASGTGTPAETGLSISNKGVISFASGQTFTGAGTITGITTASGSGLQGGVTTGNATLSLLQTCASGQILSWNGTAWVCTTVSGTGTITAVHAGTDLTGGGTAGSVTLNLDTTKVPQLAAANTFTASQTFTGSGILHHLADFSANADAIVAITQTGSGDAMDISSNGAGIVVTSKNGFPAVTANGGIFASGNFVVSNGLQVFPNVTDSNTGLTSTNVIAGFGMNTVTNGATGATISGGGGTTGLRFNTVSADFGTVGGGTQNTASGENATVIGGDFNLASGGIATVAGGFGNTASGFVSFAAGTFAKAVNDGSFVWGDNSTFNGSATVSDTAVNQFIVRAAGGVWFGTTSSPSFPSGSFISTSTGAFLSTGGTWTNSSDRNLKANFVFVNDRAILKRLMGVPIATWNYKAEGEQVRHLGPTAQDFHAAFGLGEDDKHISTVDEEGVALAAIHALYQLNIQKDKQIEELKHAVAELRARLERVERVAEKD